MNGFHRISARIFGAGLALAVVMLFTVTGNLYAQDDPIPLPPPTADPTQDDFKALEELWQEYEQEAQLRSRLDLSDYRIAYLTVNQEYAANVTQYFSAEIFDSFDAMQESHQFDPYTVLILDQSAYDLIDREWTRTAFANGLIVAGTGISYDDFTTITGEQCSPPINTDLFPQPFALASFFALDTADENREQIARVELEVCKGPELEATEQLNYSLRKATFGFLLDSEEGWIQFASNIRIFVYDIESMTQGE